MIANRILSVLGPTDPWQKKTGKRRCPSTLIADKANDFHSLKIRFLREEHEAKMMLIEKQREFSESEHRLRMDILRKINQNIPTQTSSNVPVHYENIVENTSGDVYLNNLSSMGNLLLCSDNLLPL